MMKTKPAVLLLAWLQACGLGVLQLPDAWPATMQLEVYHYGGMHPSSWKMLLTHDSCHIERRYQTREYTHNFATTDSLRSAVLALLRQQRITRVSSHDRSHDDRIYDMPTTGMRLQLGTAVWQATSSGATEIASKAQAQRFWHVYNQLDTLALQHLPLPPD